MTIDPEELEAILDDLDFMVETVRQNCSIVSFLSVAHSARKIRQILKSVIQEKDTNEPPCRTAFGKCFFVQVMAWLKTGQ